MKVINEQATKVIAWISSHYLRSGDVIAFLQAAADKKNVLEPVSKQFAPVLRKALEDFLSREYWSRVWVIQELGVNQRVVIKCGDDEVSWTWVATARQLMGYHARKPQNLGKYFSHVEGINDIRRKVLGGTETIGLIEAMRDTRESCTRDPRDKVYLLLGFCHDGARLVPHPTYAKSFDMGKLFSHITKN